MKRIFFALAALSAIFLIASCEKDLTEDSIVYPKTYTSSYITGENIKVFTKSGEITNRRLRDRILKNYKGYLTDLDNHNVENEITAIYKSPDEVEIKGIYSDNIDKRMVHEALDITYWEKKDTSIYFSSIEDAERYFEYHPIYYEIHSMPSSMGYDITAFRKCYYINRVRGGLIIPMLDYIIVNDYGFQSITGVNNKLKTNSISKLGLKDTLILQEYRIVMK